MGRGESTTGRGRGRRVRSLRVSRTHHVTASALDAADPLAGFRDRFVVPDPGLVYLDGNSLGRAPTGGHRAGRAHGRRASGAASSSAAGTTGSTCRCGSATGSAAGVLGAAPGTVVVADSTTVNLYRVAVGRAGRPAGPAGHRGRPRRLPDRPLRRRGPGARAGPRDRWLDGDPVEGLTADDVARALGRTTSRSWCCRSSTTDRPPSSISRRSTAAARDAGAHVLWDLSHAAGAIPVELDRRDVGLAVGCTYKFLYGGPGAPAWLYVGAAAAGPAPAADPGLVRAGRPVRDGRRASCRAPGSPAGSRARRRSSRWSRSRKGVALVAEAGIDAIRAEVDGPHELRHRAASTRSSRRSAARSAARGTTTRRGAHVAIRHPDARRLTAALIERGVVPDFREPDVIRFGLSPLTTSYADVDRGVSVLRELLLAP